MNFIETVESIARFTNYNLNWEDLREDKIEFSYRSVIGNLDCDYTIKNNEVLVRVSHLLFYINFNIDDTMLDIVNLASLIHEVKLINPDIKATLNTFVVNGEYGLADTINGDLDLIIKLPENDNNFEFFNTLSEQVDKIILTLGLIWDNKELIKDYNYRICIYPHVDYETQIYFSTHIMVRDYIEYMSIDYKQILQGLSLHSGYPSEANTPSGESIFLPEQPYITSLVDLGYTPKNTILITHNLIAALHILGKIYLDKDNENTRLYIANNTLHIKYNPVLVETLCLNTEYYIPSPRTQIGQVRHRGLTLEYEADIMYLFNTLLHLT